MDSVVVVGAQWGDEGKGKIVDLLAGEADMVVRFNGGHNAGHTLVIGGATYKLALIPSGVVRGCRSLIGGGAVVDPQHFRRELAGLADLGVAVGPDLLKVADNAALILSPHRELDRARETVSTGGARIGTTQRGIGPAYEDKVGRRAIRIADLRDLNRLGERISGLCAHHDPLRAACGLAPIDPDALMAELREAAEVLLPFAVNATHALAQDAPARVLYEGAQGSLLDPDFGTYPYVTSSTTLAGFASVGADHGRGGVHRVLGVVKAYATRVGEGPLPTELHDAVGTHLGERGQEFGVNTGRKRRCGWLDAVALRYAARLNGMTGMALTKIDVLDGLDCLEVCVGYELDGGTIDYLPTGICAQTRMKPVYRTFEGWRGSTADIQSMERFPQQARTYMDFIAEFTQIPLDLVSTGPDRASTIIINDPWAPAN
ncbi:adenylosuccinate synthase [Acuticoccus sediminis]|uniref:Adenylosuccinate synthetase n=1 Tax=Acuticoccus sediminis TaxID=2184697 RepID=A0A8B2NPV6_9HYPH|nr:adenylosuccinate synthase [Acuticoccus sediminis]RAI01915.1 adenylosuccinate synthase [Acuticoccus sediminis]